MTISVAVLEKLGSDATLFERHSESDNLTERSIKQWCIMMLDDDGADEVNSNQNEASETQLH